MVTENVIIVLECLMMDDLRRKILANVEGIKNPENQNFQKCPENQNFRKCPENQTFQKNPENQNFQKCPEKNSKFRIY